MRIDEIFNFEKGVLQSSKCVPGEYDFITASSDWKTHSEYTHDCEALIFAAAASGSLGRTHYVNGKFISSDLCFIITPKDQENLPVDLKFYHILFNELKDEIVRNTKAGTSKEAIGLGSFGKYKLPYFDIDTQIEIKNRFVNAEELKSELSSELLSQVDLVKKLRQQLLQDAIQGKLVEQNPKDEPARELLKKIKAEKEKLITEKKLKKEKELPPIKPEEIPFEIPENWVWCRLGEILTEIKYGTSQSCDYDHTKNSKVLRIPNVSTGVLDGEDLKYTNLSEKEISELALEKDDILIIRSNGSRELVGRPVLVTPEFIGFAYAGYLVRFRFDKELTNPRYLLTATTAPFFRGLIETPLRTTVGINNINTQEMSNLFIPLPPLTEQNRIVQKLDELIQYCNELEASIKQSESQNEKLIQQVLREALRKEPVEEEV
ncbi:MAG: restriction endonuclease subunit S [Bacteroidetes bacterium]|nr:restriction endonuclease subunit S [Bacteroidota bacterium]